MSAVELLIRKIKRANREEDVENAHKTSDLILCDLVLVLMEHCPTKDVDTVNEILEIYKAKSKNWYYA
jgi:hypothetical protein